MPRSNKTALFILALFPALIVLFGCNLLLGEGDPNPAAAYGVEREDALFLLGSQPRTLDPALTHVGPSGALGQIFSGLVRLDRELRVQPDLAAGWEVGEDGTLYTFYLRPDAVFHDGRPVTAQDVRFSWERAAAPATASDTVLTYLGDVVGVADMVTGQANDISGVRVLDDHTLEVRIDAPKVYFLAKLTYPVAFVVDQETVDRADWERRPNGTGPFKLDVWKDDQIMVLERYAAYYGEPARLAHVVYLMDAGLPLARYENGQIDLVPVGGATLERLQDPNNEHFAELRSTVSMCTSYIGFNNALPPLDDPLVRQALSYAVDTEKLIEGLLQGNALPASGPLPPGMPGYVNRPLPYRFDPEKARALLREAGYDPAEMSLTFTTAGYGDVGPYVAAVITMWQDHLGLQVEPQLLDPFTYNEQLYAGEVGHFFSSGWCADYPDPQNFLDVLFHSHSAQNLGHFSDAQIDALLEAARVEDDVAQRLAMYQEAEGLIIEEAPALFVSHGLSSVLVKPYVQGYELLPIDVPQWESVYVER